MGFVQRRLVKFVIRVVSFPKLTLAICGMALLVAVGLAWFHLSLSTDQDELLTPKLKFFRDYKDFTRRFPENDTFVVILEPQSYAKAPPAKRWMDFADRAGAALRNLKAYVTRVEAHVPLTELAEQSLLFAPWPELKTQSEQARDFAQLARLTGEAPTIADVLFLGNNMTERLYRGLARGPAKGSKELAVFATQSLASAIKSPPETWVRGNQIPDFPDLDPRAATDPMVYGYNMIPDETKRGTPAYQTDHILVINVYAVRDFLSLADVTEPLRQMRAAVEGVWRDFPEFKKPVVTGRPALDADEMSTTDRDTKISEILGLSVVFVVLFLFLRNLWLVIVAELCLSVGIGWTFGWATMAVGRLNLLSLVFVIALIGIGMDYLIQILTRYRFEKKRYGRPQAIWARVFRYVSPPISTACFGAAGAFLVSLLTNFSGAAELGLIAGGGLLLCLLAGYTVLPALLTLFPASVGKVPEHRRYRHLFPHPRAGGVRLLPAVAWMLVAGAGLYVSLPPRFDPNLLKLQADGLESVRAVRKLNTWYAVVTSADLDALRRARTAYSSENPANASIDHTESILDAMDKQEWLAAHNADIVKINWRDPAPPTPAELLAIADDAENMLSAWRRQPDAGDLAAVQAAVQELAQAIRATSPDQPAKIERIGQWQRTFIAEIRTSLNQFAPPPLDEARIPPAPREHLISPPHQSGERKLYALYVYPKDDLWDSKKLEAFVKTLKERLPSGMTVTGIAPQLYDSTQEIHEAFLKATLYAMILIFILVFLDLRRLSQTLLAISVLALGLPMLLLMMWLWHSIHFGGQTLEEWTGIPGTWNFANFFGLPILIGAGHEYGVFMVHRYREALHDPRRVWRTWDVSDRALLLCGIVTSASFGFLIIAKHHGLQSLGWVMAVGTACIYLSALLVLRPILVWRLKHKGVYYQVEE